MSPSSARGSGGPERIFVFGSNEAGRHGAGAALHARRHWGAVYGQGVGRTGRAYGIPTKDARLRVLPLPAIERHVQAFLAYALQHPELQFEVTKIGCGLAGYSEQRISRLFVRAPSNCILPVNWRGSPQPTAPGGFALLRESLLNGTSKGSRRDR